MSHKNQVLSEDEIKAARLSVAARRLWQPGLPGEAYLDQLDESGLIEDALRLFPQLLSQREAVWWGCLCAWEMARPEVSPRDREALSAACRWVSEPSEANRRAAYGPGMACDLATAAGCLAMAAYSSAGSMADAGLPEIPAPPYLSAQLVSAGVLLASIQHTPIRFDEHSRRFLCMGRQIMQGLHRWPEPDLKPSSPRQQRPAATRPHVDLVVPARS